MVVERELMVCHLKESSTYIPPETNDAVLGSFDEGALHEDDTAPAINSPTHGPKTLDDTTTLVSNRHLLDRIFF